MSAAGTPRSLSSFAIAVSSLLAIARGLLLGVFALYLFERSASCFSWGLNSGGTLGDIDLMRGALFSGAVEVKDLGGVGGTGLLCSSDLAFLTQK